MSLLIGTKGQLVKKARSYYPKLGNAFQEEKLHITKYAYERNELHKNK